MGVVDVLHYHIYMPSMKIEIMTGSLQVKDKPAVQHGRLKDGGEEEELLLLVVDGLGNKHGFIAVRHN